ncbi:fibronectin type III domain-containing protein [Marinobacteraceae bacterium S3BR75-40.1]
MKSSPARWRQCVWQPYSISLYLFLGITLLLSGCGGNQTSPQGNGSTAPSEASATTQNVAQRSARNTSSPATPEQETDRIDKETDSGWFEGYMGDEASSADEEGATGETEGTIAGNPAIPQDTTNESTPPPQEITNDSLDSSDTQKSLPPQEAPPSLLSWSPPLTREDGSKLYPSEIEKYRIYYRDLDQQQYQTLEVPEGTNSVRLSQFGPGMYEFSITAVDISGLESQRSQSIQVEVAAL